LLAVSESYYPTREIEGSEPWITKTSMPEGMYSMGVVGLADTLPVFGGKLDENRIDNLLQ
jgi:hypothetical protein